MRSLHLIQSILGSIICKESKKGSATHRSERLLSPFSSSSTSFWSNGYAVFKNTPTYQFFQIKEARCPSTLSTVDCSMGLEHE